MSIGVLGKKVGMTQVFDADGKAVPVTVIEAGPCLVVEIRTPEKNRYRLRGGGPAHSSRPDCRAQPPTRLVACPLRRANHFTRVQRF